MRSYEEVRLLRPLLYMSDDGYLAESSFNRFTPLGTYRRFKYGGIDFTIAIECEKIWISISGTTTTRERLLDLMVLFKRSKANKGVKLHKGFFKGAKAIKDIIFAQIESASNCKEIVVAGHSLGGALAQIIALWATKRFKDRSISVISYAAPRVGNSRYADIYAKKVSDTLLIENMFDIVPMIPPSPYRKARVPKLVLGKGRLWRYLIIPFTMLYWHSPKTYIKEIAKLLHVRTH